MKLKDYPIIFLERKFKAERNSKIKLRVQMMMHLREGYTQREVSTMLRVSTGIVPYWKARFEKEGFDGLRDKEGRGLKPKLSEEQLSMIASAIEDGVLMEDGYRRGFKTKDVNQLIREEFGYSYTNRHCLRILDSIDFALIVPRPRNKSRNQNDVNKFTREFKKKERVWAMT